jgi:hypothetical protein
MRRREGFADSTNNFSWNVRGRPVRAHDGVMTQAAVRWRDRNRPVALTSEDVERALCGLSDGDLFRVRALASLRGRGLPGGIGWADLLQETVLRALDGSRGWPAGVPFVAFLAGARGGERVAWYGAG